MSSAGETTTTGTDEFLVSLVVNIAMGCGAFLAISFLRRRLTYYFDGRRSDFRRNPGYIPSSRYLERPPRQACSGDEYGGELFGWVWQTISLPENIILRSVGPDAVLLLRFFLRMAFFLTLYAIFAFIIIIPMQFIASKENGITGFNAVSLLSLDDNDNRLYVHLIFIYFTTILLCTLLNSQWQDVIKLKQRWLGNEQLLGRRMTLMVTDLPQKCNTNIKLYNYFNKLYPNEILGAYIVTNHERLTELYTLRESAVNEINIAKGNMELDSKKIYTKEQEIFNKQQQKELKKLNKTNNNKKNDKYTSDSIILDDDTDNNTKQQRQQNDIITSDIDYDNDVSLTRHIEDVERPKGKIGFLGLFGREVDIIDYYTNKVQEYDNEIKHILYTINAYNYAPSEYRRMYNLNKQQEQEQQQKEKTKENKNNQQQQVDETDTTNQKSSFYEIKNTHIGFVTFKSSIALANALQLPITNSFTQFKTELAPEPLDLSWYGVTKTTLYKYIMSVIMNIIHFALVIFWTIPVTFISGLMTIESLSKRIPFLEPVLTFHPLVKSFLSGWLPGLALVIFMALLPKILMFMGWLKGIESQSGIAMYVTKKYYVFQLVNFYLVAVLSTSIMHELDGMVNNPASIPSKLASGVPQSALLFVNYIQIRSLFTNIFSIIDPVDLILNYIIFIFFSKSPQSAIQALNPTPYLYQKVIPEAMLILIISFTFGTIQPIILVFGALYFFTLWFSKKYMTLFISVTPYETAGSFYPLMFNRIMLGLIVGQLTLLGLFSLKEHAIVSILMLPLIICTIWYWYFQYERYMGNKANIITDKEGTEYIRLTSIMARRCDYARSLLSYEQKQAIIEGYALPTEQPYISLLPILMSDVFGDTIQRDKNLKKLGSQVWNESQKWLESNKIKLLFNYNPFLLLSSSSSSSNNTIDNQQQQELIIDNQINDNKQQEQNNQIVNDDNNNKYLYQYEYKQLQLQQQFEEYQTLFVDILPELVPILIENKRKVEQEKEKEEKNNINTNQDNNKKIIYYQRDFLYLGEQYHGDDLADLPLYHHKAQYLYDLLTNNTIDWVFKPFWPCTVSLFSNAHSNTNSTDDSSLNKKEKQKRKKQNNNTNNIQKEKEEEQHPHPRRRLFDIEGGDIISNTNTNNNKSMNNLVVTSNKKELLNDLQYDPDIGVGDDDDNVNNNNNGYTSDNDDDDQDKNNNNNSSFVQPLLNNNNSHYEREEEQEEEELKRLNLLNLLSFEQRLALIKHVLRWKRHKEFISLQQQIQQEEEEEQEMQIENNNNDKNTNIDSLLLSPMRTSTNNNNNNNNTNNILKSPQSSLQQQQLTKQPTLSKQSTTSTLPFPEHLLKSPTLSLQQQQTTTPLSNNNNQEEEEKEKGNNNNNNIIPKDLNNLPTDILPPDYNNNNMNNNNTNANVVDDDDIIDIDTTNKVKRTFNNNNNILVNNNNNQQQEEEQDNNNNYYKYKEILNNNIIEQQQVMARYMQPELNPSFYSHIYDRVWGDQYLLYRAQHAMKK